MKGDDLRPEDHIVRYVRPKSLRQDCTADGSAFLLRPDRPDEVGLSVHWLEVLSHNKVQQLAKVRQLNRLKRNDNGRFAELNVGEVIARVSQEFHPPKIVEDPLDPNNGYVADLSHALVLGLPPGDSDEAILIGDLIAECVSAMHLANDK